VCVWGGGVGEVGVGVGVATKGGQQFTQERGILCVQWKTSVCVVVGVGWHCGVVRDAVDVLFGWLVGVDGLWWGGVCGLVGVGGGVGLGGKANGEKRTAEHGRRHYGDNNAVGVDE